MKKLILTLGIFLIGVMSINAQDKVATKIVNKMTVVCGLSSDQVAKVQPIVEDYVKGREANKQQYASDPEGLKTANRTLNKNYKAQLKTVLSPEQIEKLKAYKAQHKGDKKGAQEEEQESDGQQ